MKICKFITKLAINQRRKNRKRLQIVTAPKKDLIVESKPKPAPTNWVINVKNQLKIDEGCKFEVYLDTEGLATFGVGHLITKADPEYAAAKKTWPFIFDEDLTITQKMIEFKNSKKRLGISPSRVQEAFEQDLLIAIMDAKRIFEGFNEFRDELKEIIVNMAFNLGHSRLKGFKRKIAAVQNGDYEMAAKEMEKSKWHRQVGDRAKRLVARMKALA